MTRRSGIANHWKFGGRKHRKCDITPRALSKVDCGIATRFEAVHMCVGVGDMRRPLMPSYWKGLNCTTGTADRFNVTMPAVPTLNNGTDVATTPTWRKEPCVEHCGNGVTLFTRHQPVSAVMLEITELELEPGTPGL